MKQFKFRYKDADGKPYYKVVELPDDAAQFVTCDKNGNEVYEGDTVILDEPKYNFRKEYKAELLRQGKAEDGCILFRYLIAESSTLKENSDETV